MSQEKFIHETADILGISVENVYYFSLTNGIEGIGEFISELDDEYQEVNISTPLRIIRNNMVFNDDLSCNVFLVDWNPCSDDMVISLAKHSLASLSVPNTETIYLYMKAIHDDYFNNDLLQNDSMNDNVINLDDYR